MSGDISFISEDRMYLPSVEASCNSAPASTGTSSEASTRPRASVGLPGATMGASHVTGLVIAQCRCTDFHTGGCDVAVHCCLQDIPGFTCTSLPSIILFCMKFSCRFIPGIPWVQADGYGIDSIGALLEAFGYTRRDFLAFPQKKLRAFWFSPPPYPSVPPAPSGGRGEHIGGAAPSLPRVFVSELAVEELSAEAQVSQLGMQTKARKNMCTKCV